MNNGEGATQNKSRKFIYNYIASHPGASFGAIRNIFEMKSSTLQYHLTYLERDKMIKSKREGRRRCYYCPQKVHPGENTTSVELNKLTEIQKQILQQIQNEPGITRKELCEKNRVNKKKLSYTLKRLGDMNLIWLTKDNGVAGYEYISKEKLRTEIFKRLIKKFLADEIDEESYHKIKKKLEKLDIDEIEV